MSYFYQQLFDKIPRNSLRCTTIQKRTNGLLFSFNSIKKEYMEITINVPKTARDIKLGQYMKWSKIFENNSEAENNFLEIKMLEIFCNLDPREASKLPLGAADEAINHIVGLLNQKHKLTERFTMVGADGVELEFGLIPNLSKMTLGEYVDLDTYVSKFDELNRAMAVIYRPMDPSWKGKDSYRISEYQGTDLMAEIMKDMPMDIAIGALLFFYRLETKLSSLSTISSLSKVPEETLIESEEAKTHFLNAMDGIRAYMRSREEMLSKSIPSLNSMSTKP